MHWLLVSDVDGTLLDERGRFAVPAAALRGRWREVVPGGTLALASSRTLAELRGIQRRLRVPGPLLAEDGALLAHDRAILRLAEPRAALLATWHRLALTEDTGLREVSALDAAALDRYGLHTPGRRRRAVAERQASLLLECGTTTPAGWQQARDALTARGYAIARGGRWATLTRSASKRVALQHLRQRLPHDLFVVAIGNDENDVSLLEGADLAFAVPGRDGRVPTALAAVPHVIVLAQPATHGWLEMLSHLATHRGRG